MHELPATQGLLATAIDAAEKAGARRVLGIDLVIGDLCTMVDDSVQMYFDVLSRGTIAEGARLHFRRAPGEATCFDCAARFPVAPPLPEGCPTCGSGFVRVVGGRQFLVESIEVDDEGRGSH